MRNLLSSFVFLVLFAEEALSFLSVNLRPLIATTTPTFLESPRELAASHGRDSSRLFFFFGDRVSDSKEKELATFPKLATTNTDVKFEGLLGFLSDWSKNFEQNRKEMGLTTAVKVFSSLEEDKQPDSNILKTAGVRIVFQRSKTGDSYKNKKEEDAAKRGEGETKQKAPPKEGGVQIQVEKLASGELQVRARRCDVEEDTMIKEMSEEAIISQLKKAIQVWKKEYAD